MDDRASEHLVVTPEPGSRPATRRDTPVRCHSCGRSVVRKARQQKFCSKRCRDREIGRRRTRKALLGTDTRAPADYPKFINKNNGLRATHSRPNPRISAVLDALARKAATTLKWPAWTQADYRRAFERLERDPVFNPSKRDGRKAA